MRKTITLAVFIALVLVSWVLKNNEIPAVAEETGVLKVHFIDVGQADCALIKTDTAVMLIDGGNADDSGKIIEYLKKYGVGKIDFIIGTHPHEDHIGGLAEIISEFEVGKIYLPKVQTTTATFEDLLTVIQSKGLKVTTAKAGMVFDLDQDTKCEIYSPANDEYEELNSYSAVVKITYGYTTFLFAGDVEATEEIAMLEAGYNLNADVLKVAHHGSGFSSTEEFLDAVTPEYAVISVGKDNSYGHPHDETLERLAGVQIYRTDVSGTVVITSDGETLTVKEEK